MLIFNKTIKWHMAQEKVAYLHKYNIHVVVKIKKKSKWGEQSI